MDGSGCVSGAGRAGRPVVPAEATASMCASVAPFATGADWPCSSVTVLSCAGAVAAAAAAPSVAASFTTLSSAGRLASGKSVGAEGEEGSSRGRFAEDIAVVEVGDADMSRDLGESPGIDLFSVKNFLLFFFSEELFIYTRSVEGKLAGVTKDSGARNARKEIVNKVRSEGRAGVDGGIERCGVL